MSWEVAAIMSMGFSILLLYGYQKDLPDERVWAQWLKVFVLGVSLVLGYAMLAFTNNLIALSSVAAGLTALNIDAFMRGYLYVTGGLFSFVALKLIRDTFTVLQEVNKRYGR